MGIYFDETINNRLRGVSRSESLEIILERYEGPALSKEKKAELMESKNNTYRELLASMTPADVTEDVRRTLAELHNRGYKLALGSSSKNAKFILEKVQLLDAFDAISDGTNITKSKPDPEVFLRAAEFLGEKPEDCYVVEDAYAGIDAAKSAGMQAVGIGIAAGYAAADVKIQSFGELLTLGALKMNEKTSNFGNADVSIIGGFLLNRVSQFLKKSWFFPLFVYDICRTGEKTIIVFDW